MTNWNEMLNRLDAFIRQEFRVEDPRRWAFKHRRDGERSVKRIARSYLKCRRNASVPA